MFSVAPWIRLPKGANYEFISPDAGISCKCDRRWLRVERCYVMVMLADSWSLIKVRMQSQLILYLVYFGTTDLL